MQSEMFKNERRMNMNPYSRSEKGYDRQLAASYIIYMMCGSLFRESVCTNPCEERHLYLHYVGMPLQKQYEREEEVLKLLEPMEEELRRRLGELKCEVHFQMTGTTYQILFETGGFETVTGNVDDNGKLWIDF